MGKDNVIKKIHEIDQTFDLIILADDEYFEDGMILLKNSLCWKYEDVMNVKHLVFKHQSYLSDESVKIIKDWLWQDYILYDHYKTQFMDRVKAFGRQELNVEKEMLQKVSLQAMNECSSSR